TSIEQGIVSAWVRADNTTSGDYDLYIYGDTQSTLAMAAGLGGNGVFHYWNGSMVDTAVAYAADTWYLVQLEFDAASDTYNFAIYDTTFAELVRVDGISFGGAISTGLDRIMVRTSTTFSGNAHIDDVRLQPWADPEPTVTLGAESTQTFTDAWSRVTKVITSTSGATIRWYFSANDTGDNWATSDVYTFVTQVEDTPPTVTLNYPVDNHWVTTSSVDFSATCVDEYDVTQVSLYGDWGGSWDVIDTVSGPGLSGTEVVFSETVPDGAWTWNVACEDDTANTAWGTERTIYVDSEPDPWWQCGYDYRVRLTIHENAGHALADYPVYATVDTATLIAAGKMQADCDDVRVTYDGAEIPSQVVGCNASDTRIWLQTDLAASAGKPGFYLYYGNPTATAADYSAQVSISWNGGSSTMDTGAITAVFDPDGGIISQVGSDVNGQDLMIGDDQRGLGYLFSENSSVHYIFRVDESDDSIALTVDGPIVKVVTSYSGESPQWVQESVFYNGQDFIDFTVYRPGAAPAERFLTGGNLLSPDGVYSAGDADELLRVDDSTTDTAVVFDEVWRFSPTDDQGYVGVVDPTFTNELAFVWDETDVTEFTWKPRSAAPRAGTYSLFIGGDGTLGQYGTIDTDVFDYRFVLQHSTTPDNASTQSVYDYAVTAPPTVEVGPEETPVADTTPPTVTISSPTEATYYTQDVPLSFSTSEGVGWCGYALDGGGVVELPDCADTVISGLTDGAHELTVYATDCAGNTGSSSVSFEVQLSSFGWWDIDWHYRVPLTIDAGVYTRTQEPVEYGISFTQAWTELGRTGLTFDTSSVRVVEYASDGSLVGEVASQFDPAADYDAATNAAGTLVWIMGGTTDAHTTRHYYVYFDSTDSAKAAPSYATGLTWDSGTHTLSNTSIDATLGSVLSGGLYRTGIPTLVYQGVEYTLPGGLGIYYLASGTGGADTYDTPIDGPVKKTIRVTPAANGVLTFTLYAQSSSIKAEGLVSDSPWTFTPFPYAHNLNGSALSDQLHYYNDGAVVDESVGTLAWLSDAPDEGWVCYHGVGDNEGLCLVADDATLASSNNLWRYDNTTYRQLIFPAWNPSPTFPIQPTSWIVMADTYQVGRDFWSRLTSPVTVTSGLPQAQETKAIVGVGPVGFGILDITVNVQTQGALSSIQIVQFSGDHPEAISGIQSGYWSITPNDGATGYTADLTLPHDGLSDPQACRYVEGSGWDCARSSFDSESVTRTGVDTFSDWAVGNDMPPTAIGIWNLEAAPHVKMMPAFLGILSLGLAIAWLLVVRRRRG
ncbi:MAG: hypothetical protein PVI59_12105, partial [Anaerolineae bacterium]